MQSPRNHEDVMLLQLEKTVFHVGDPHPTMSVHEDVQRTVDSVVRECEHGGVSTMVLLADALVGCMLEQAQKSDIYVQLLKALAAKHRALTESVFQRMFVLAGLTFKSADMTVEWRHCHLCWILLAKCVGQGVLSVDGFGGFVKKMSLKSEFMRWCVLSILPLLPSALAVDLRSWALEHSSSDSCADLKTISDIVMDMDFESLNVAVGASDAGDVAVVDPFESVIVNSKEQSVAGWESSFCLLDCEWRFLKSGGVVFADGISDYEIWTAVMVCRHLVEAMEMNHRKCADYLLSIRGVKSVDALVFVFLVHQMTVGSLQQRQKPLVYEMLLVDLCRQSPKTFPPIMARQLRSIFSASVCEDQEMVGDGKRSIVDGCNVVVIGRLASWFALHLSNFDFVWNWTLWMDRLMLDSATADASMDLTFELQMFVKMTLEKLFALSYAERLLGKLPEQLVSWMPRSLDSKRIDGGGNRFLHMIENRASVEDLSRLVEEAAADASSSDCNLDEMRRQAMDAMLYVASISPSRWMAVVERYLAVFQRSLMMNDVAGRSLDQMHAYFESNLGMFEFYIDRMIKLRLLHVGSLFTWLGSRVQLMLGSSEAFSFAEQMHVIMSMLRPALVVGNMDLACKLPMIAADKMAMANAEAERIERTVSSLQAEAESARAVILDALRAVASGDDRHVFVSIAAQQLIDRV